MNSTNDVKKIYVLIVESHTEYMYINFVSLYHIYHVYVNISITQSLINIFFYTFWRKIFIRHKWKKKGAGTTSDEKDNTMPNVRNQKKEPMYLKLLKIICSLHRLLWRTKLFVRLPIWMPSTASLGHVIKSYLNTFNYKLQGCVCNKIVDRMTKLICLIGKSI